MIVFVAAACAHTWAATPVMRGARRFSRTTTFQGGLLFGTADTMAQTLQHEPLNPGRISSFAAFGAFYVGTVGTAWYRWIDRVAPKRNPATGLATKVVATWLVLGAAGNYVNMMYQRMCETRDFQAATEYTRAHVKDVILNDLKIWPAFDTILFTVVPPPLRPTTLILMSLAWNTYTSMASHQ